jgi:hypothetical protein
MRSILFPILWLLLCLATMAGCGLLSPTEPSSIFHPGRLLFGGATPPGSPHDIPQLGSLVMCAMLALSVLAGLYGLRTSWLCALGYGAIAALAQVLAWNFLSDVLHQLTYLVPIVLACGFVVVVAAKWHDWHLGKWFKGAADAPA